MDKELNALIGLELKLQMMDSHNGILRTDKLEKITKMVISLNKLDNSDNLEEGRPSNTFTFLTLKITDQANNVITDGPGMTVVLHILDHKIQSPIKMEYGK